MSSVTDDPPAERDRQLRIAPGGRMAMKDRTKTEHAGAKNGGGYFGKRLEAKTVSRSLRRARDKDVVREQLDPSAPVPMKDEPTE